MNKSFLVLVLLSLSYLGYSIALEGVTSLTHTQQIKQQQIEEMIK